MIIFFKYKIFFLSLFIVLFSVNGIAQTKATETRTINGKKFIIHKVEKGQSLYAIAKLYNTDINYILAENDEAIDGIKPGQEIKIPSEMPSVTNTASAIDTNTYVYHKVAKGETIYAITKRFLIEEKQLLFLNPNLNKGLKEGDYVIVGKKTKTEKPQITNNTNPKLSGSSYTVLKGETLYAISKKVNVSVDDLIALNPEAKNGLKEGQVLNTLSTVNSIDAKSYKNDNAKVAQTSIKTFVNDTTLTVIAKQKKNSYKIGLFLPFKLNEIDNINIDELIKNKQQFPSTYALVADFYSGFKKALDSLQDKDFETELVLFDVQERDSAKTEAICKTNEFKTLDFIFGPLYPNEFKIVAGYAKKLQIPAISPLTQQTKILYNNAFVSKTNPSVHVLIEELAHFALDSLLDNSKLILMTSTPKDLSYIKTFKNEFNANLTSHGKSIKDSISEVRGMAGVKAAYVAGKKNVVVLFTNNLVYIQDFVTQLYQFSDKKDIVLMGFSSMANIDNLDQEYLNQLQFHFPTASQVNFSDSLIIPLIKEYQSYYGSDPSDIYFNAFDIGYYYLANLKQNGPSFIHSLENYKWEGLSTQFKFYRPDAETGYENKSTYIYKYSDYKLQRLGWK